MKIILILASMVLTMSATANDHARTVWPLIAEFEVPPESDLTIYGYSSAIDGNTIAMGSIFTSVFIPPPNPLEPGTVYLYLKESQSQWVLNKALVGDDSQPGDQFGFQVALSGNLLVVSSPYDDEIYIYEKNRGGLNNWGRLKKIAGDAGLHNYFGSTLAITNNIIAVGGENGNIQVFQQNIGGENNWGQSADLEIENYITKLAVSGNTLIAAASSGDMPSAVYIFEKDLNGVNQWGMSAKLTPNDENSFKYFARSVAFSNNTIAVFGYKTSGIDNIVGSVHIFDRDSTNSDKWEQSYVFLGQEDGIDYAPNISLDHDLLALKNVNGITASPGNNKTTIYQRNASGWDPIAELPSAGEREIKIKGNQLLMSRGFGQLYAAQTIHSIPSLSLAGVLLMITTILLLLAISAKKPLSKVLQK